MSSGHDCAGTRQRPFQSPLLAICEGSAVASGVIDTYPKSNYAWQAGEELERDFGFTRLPIHDQFAAPIGSVLVFGSGPESHVVIRTKNGFASDYWTKNRCKYPLVAVYAKY